MGWLELLPLLRRVLPLLDRVTPLLESAIAGRLGSKSVESERTQAAVAALSESHTDLQSSLDTQREILVALAAQVRSLDATTSALHGQIAAADNRVAAVARAMRIAFVVLFLLLLCTIVLLLLLLRHK